MTMTLLAGLLSIFGGHPDLPALQSSSPPAWDTQQQVCPASNERARAKVERFLTLSHAAPVREQYQITGVNPAHLRLLSDQRDAATCRKIRALITPTAGRSYEWVFYEADGFLFVMVIGELVRQPSGRTRIDESWHPLYVLDRKFTVIGPFGL